MSSAKSKNVYGLSLKQYTTEHYALRDSEGLLFAMIVCNHKGRWLCSIPYEPIEDGTPNTKWRTKDFRSLGEAEQHAMTHWDNYDPS